MEISDSEKSDNEPMTPPELSKETEESAEATETDPGQHIIPEYSREKYFRAYEVFKEWQMKHGHDEVTEAVMMEFFEELNETKKPSTLWSQYSMLKSTFNLKEDLDISQFKKLRAYLKKQGTGQMEASNILKTRMSDIQQPQSHPSTQIIINQIPINQQVGGRRFQTNQGQIITTPKRLYTTVGQLINNAGKLININNSGQVNNNGNASQGLLGDNQQVDSGQHANREQITMKSTGHLQRVQINKQINLVQKPKTSVDDLEASLQTLNLDGFKFVVVEIDRRIEVVQKGWSPPEGAEYVKPHAIFDSYKSASDYADTINVKKTTRVVPTVVPSPKVISIDADSSNCPEASTQEIRRVVKSGLPIKPINVVKTKVAPTSTPSGSCTPKRIIGTLVKKNNNNQSISVTSANGLKNIVKNKRFIGTLVNKNFNKNSIVSNKQKLDSKNAKSGNFF
ncbi:hypothetical protein G9C98_002747 [Cotesia typhae]|uniref:Uncharacterized protein n=1 Tax=Cotesia typhae TaxID=2053667 RepID=A0A8J5RJS9_9HYME|nr:hypothetical protein G9C98_002747 [Cotesia typhae]